MKRERFLVVAYATCLAFWIGGDAFEAHLGNRAVLCGLLAWLFVVILGSSLAVVRHAERLAARLGEPYGTLILTLSVTVIEVTSIAAVMLHGEENPTLARDTLFAVVMIILNGMVGASLLIGALIHREQHHNLQGANTYLGVAIPLIVLSLVLPDYTLTTPGATLSFAQQVFLVVVSLGLYGTFLVLQTGRHRAYFATEPPDDAPVPMPPTGREPLTVPTLLLFAYLVPALFLAQQLSRPIDYLIETLRAPTAFGGVFIALLVAAPEAIGAVRAAMTNRLQRSINVFLGSILSTLGITIPAMIVIGEFTHQTLVLGVQHADLVLLSLTLVVSIVTFSSGRTNMIQGLVHLVLFAAYLMLIVQD